jgi:hypothetical protein
MARQIFSMGGSSYGVVLMVVYLNVDVDVDIMFLSPFTTRSSIMAVI